MLTMTRIGASRDAWEYLSQSIQEDEYPAGDAITPDSRLDYYLKDGTPPGRWIGSGAAVFGLDGKTVTETQMKQLFNEARNPVTGSQLGKAYERSEPVEQRIEQRIRALDPNLSPQEFYQAADNITEEELSKPQKQSVAGFEFVTSPPKSVSAWWALADPELKTQIQAEYRAAVNELIEKMEQEFKTRIGHAGAAQSEIQGLAVAAFDHWDSRNGDPQLHTHLCVANRVQGSDGIWRTIDSRYSLTPRVAELGAYFDTILMDKLTARFGVRWEPEQFATYAAEYPAWLKAQAAGAAAGKDQDWLSRDTPQARFDFTREKLGSLGRVKWQITGIPDTLLKEYSSRSHDLNLRVDQKVHDYQKRHGRAPSPRTIINMRQQAALETRKKKSMQSLKQLTASWRKRAEPIVGDTFLFAERIAKAHKTRQQRVMLETFRADDFDDSYIARLTGSALAELSRTRSTWTETNAATVIHRLTASYRFRSSTDRDTLNARILDAVLGEAIRLTPHEKTITPKQWRFASGESKFNPRIKAIYTTREVWWAEDRILKAGQTRTAHALTEEVAARLAQAPTRSEGRTLSGDQQQAVTKLLTSGRSIDVLVGPAGSGKTTSLEKLLEIWEEQYGAGTVKGLAPTAKAADVLGQTLGIETENTAKWIHDTSLGRARSSSGFSYELTPDTLLIVDEASLAGTMALDTLRAQAETVGAKILLVGDWAQLSSVDSGGAFGLLATARGDVAEITSLFRFTHDWEAKASKLLRVGKTEALREYEKNDRLHWGLEETIIDQAVTAWKRDEESLRNPEDPHPTHRTSLLIAPTQELVHQLNTAARQWRIDHGLVDTSRTITLKEGEASPGDRIVTRKNMRQLKTYSGKWVKNNDEWVIQDITESGEIIASAAGDTVTLPAAYVAESVQLAYATTAHRAQGRTVDTAHVLVDEATTRETFYVGMTRGRSENHAYVIQDVAETESGGVYEVTKAWPETLDGILNNTSKTVSAHETIVEETERLTSVAQLLAEHQTIYAHALHEHYRPLLESLHLTGDTETDNPFIGPLLANMKRLEAAGHDPRQIIPRLAGERELDTARNKLAVLHSRTAAFIATHNVTVPRVAGLIEQSLPVASAETDQALTEREEQIQLRAELLVDRAHMLDEPWLQHLPKRPGESENDWRKRAVTIACYRDLYGITGESPVGESEPDSRLKKQHYLIAQTALTAPGSAQETRPQQRRSRPGTTADPRLTPRQDAANPPSAPAAGHRLTF